MRSFAGRITSIATLVCSACGTPTSAPPPLDLSGQWNGHGSDSQGAETFTVAFTQSGTSLAGQVTTTAEDPNDGSCASCHKSKIGVVSGSVSGRLVTVTMTFPTGGNVPTPICSVTLNASTTEVTSEQIVANYSGGDSCEGPFVDGAFSLVKK